MMRRAYRLRLWDAPAAVADGPAEPQTPQQPRKRPVSEYLPRRFSENSNSPSVRFAEPVQTPPMTPQAISEADDDAGSDAALSDSESSSGRASKSRSRRAPRKSAKFLLAYPAPTMASKRRLSMIRSKLLLQLHHVPCDGLQRPRPMLDVHMASVFAGSLLGAASSKRWPRLAHLKREVCMQDVMVVKSDDYHMEEGNEAETAEDNLRKRDLVAILSPSPKEDKAEIVLADGTIWTATPRLNSVGNIQSYEFTTCDPSGRKTTARWVKRPVVGGLMSLPGTPTSTHAPQTTPATDYKFTFSFIDPTRRQHPIMGTLTPSCLDIQETYTTVSGATGDLNESKQRRSVHTVENWQKHIMQISAIWVALRHRWTPNYWPNLCSRDFRARSNSSGPESRSSMSSARDVSYGSPTAPKRSASTGAAFMRRRKNFLKTHLEDDAESLMHSSPVPGLSDGGNEWAVPTRATRDLSRRLSGELSRESSAESKAIVTGYFPVAPAASAARALQASPTIQTEKGNHAKLKHHKWKSVSGWFHRLRAH